MTLPKITGFLSIQRGSHRTFSAGVDTVKGFNFAVLKFRDFLMGTFRGCFHFADFDFETSSIFILFPWQIQVGYTRVLS